MKESNKKALAILISFFFLLPHAHLEEVFKGENVEDFPFDADVSRLMDIIINSLYTNKDVFLRELISNGSDAIDKIKYLSLTNRDILEDYKDFRIEVEFNKEEKTISIRDTGIGMTKESLIKHLGTVGKSGTVAFVEALKKGDSSTLIGQFGVGFYSAYLVAKKVVVHSKHPDGEQYIWTSMATNTFSVQKDPEGNTLGRGTKVILHLKEDALEYLDQATIKKMILKYSEFINYPINLFVEKTISKEVEIESEGEVEAEIAKAKKVYICIYTG